MKVFFTFKIKKPIKDPIKGNNDNPLEKQTHVKIITMHPATKPSMPSIKFVKFIKPVINVANIKIIKILNNWLSEIKNNNL